MTLKSRGKPFLLCLVCLLLSILLGVAAMTCVYLLPTGRMLTKADESIPILENEGGSFYWAPPDDASTRLDGYTDTIMLQTAVYIPSGSALQEAMRNNRVEFFPEKWNPQESLIRYVYGVHEGPVVSYARYWNGYLLLLKPLMLFFNLSQIRTMDMAVQFLLLFALLILSFRRGGLRLAVPLALAFLSLNPVSTALSLQYSSIYLLTLVFLIAMLALKSWEKQWGYGLFLFLGIDTAFFDFLTYPAAAVGLCLGVQVVMGKQDARTTLARAVGSGAAWAFGYGGMWAGKWLAASLITGENVLSEAVSQAQYRSGGQIAGNEGSGSAGFFAVAWKNLSVYGSAAGILVLLLIIAVLLCLLIGRHGRLRPQAGQTVGLCLVFLVPFVWYFLVRNHSMVHYWMTHRNLSAAVFALAAFVSFSLQFPKEPCQHG